MSCPAAGVDNGKLVILGFPNVQRGFEESPEDRDVPLIAEYVFKDIVNGHFKGWFFHKRLRSYKGCCPAGRFNRPGKDNGFSIENLIFRVVSVVRGFSSQLFYFSKRKVRGIRYVLRGKAPFLEFSGNFQTAFNRPCSTAFG
jgi:hypothetical protein